MSRQRIPSLDGFRALAIALVLLGHLQGAPGFGTWRVLTWLGDYAYLGVRIFFVISGFLITTLLLTEADRTGGVSLPRFYLRRTVRIFPPYYTYILAMVCLEAAGWITLRPGDVRAALTYTMNYHRDRAWYLGHAWSLAVEEQFYVLWPLALVWLRERRAMILAAAVVVIVPGIRVATKFLWPSTTLGIGETFQSVADALAAGCLLAGFVRTRWATHPRYRRALSSRLFWLVPIGVIVVNMIPIPLAQWAGGETVMNLGLAVTIDAFVRVRRDVVFHALNWPVIMWLGALSYSLYLWQQPFVGHAQGMRFPVSIALAIGAAVISFYVIERPSLRIRQRFERGREPQPTPTPAL